MSVNTPIVDFVQNYIQKKTSRFHMPGHKGHVFFGCEPFDITEIKGADVLHHGQGIIRESEHNASVLFGSGATHYSTEGSSLCIKAMLAILLMEKKKGKQRPYILAARNVHRSMIDACALLDLDVRFIGTAENTSICSCVITKENLLRAFAEQQERPLAVYVTSPDYMGQITDIALISAVCREYDIPLLVDNAHGAYLHFMETPLHPLDLGAAMCCDSAHKTLPVLTGGAYLHIHKDYVKRFEAFAAQAFQLFGSTSPSYLIMQSLDLCNAYLDNGYAERLSCFLEQMQKKKRWLKEQGIPVKSSEPLKIIIHTAKAGYSGEEIADELREYDMECEYADKDAVVLMVSLENTRMDEERMKCWAANTRLHDRKKAITENGAFRHTPKRAMTIREAVLSKSEQISVKKAKGRVCASEVIACPPAIPIAVCGEVIDEIMIAQFQKYHIRHVCVVAGGE